MRALGDLASSNFSKGVEALACGREGVHEMHAVWEDGLVAGGKTEWRGRGRTLRYWFGRWRLGALEAVKIEDLGGRGLANQSARFICRLGRAWRVWRGGDLSFAQHPRRMMGSIIIIYYYYDTTILLPLESTRSI